METQHPNKDPLKLAGRVIGYDSDPSRRFTIEVFSHPAVHKVSTPDEDEDTDVIGESYRYSVKMNYKNGGRKVITCIVASTDITDNQFSNERLTLKTIKYLEHTAEEMQANQQDDLRIDWDAQEPSA